MRWVKPISLSVLYLLFLFVLSESAARAFLVYYKGADFWNPQSLLTRYYYNVGPALRAPAGKSATHFNILLLGGSVLNPGFSDVAKQLHADLAERHIPARIYDAAAPAHTSLDSFFKYSLLAGHHFDLVLFYHGINEVRANNCPDRIYRNDYSHFSWYREMWLFYRHYHELRYVALPYVAKLFVLKLKMRLLRTRFAAWIDGSLPVPMNMPYPPWVKYGSHIKTGVAFGRNVSKIAAIARKRGEKLLLVSFATYLPADYTQKRFVHGKLDYANQGGKVGMPVEIWGDPKNVAKAIAVHNEVLRRVAAAHPEVHLFDMAKRMPKQGCYFEDICHFSPAGSRAFSSMIAPVIAGLLGH